MNVSEAPKQTVFEYRLRVQYKTGPGARGLIINEVEVPMGAVYLGVGLPLHSEGEEAVVYVRAFKDNVIEPRRFHVVGSWCDLPLPDYALKYLGTVRGNLVYEHLHVFLERTENEMRHRVNL